MGKHFLDVGVNGSNTGQNGRRDILLVEPTVIDIFVLARWSGVKTNITELAKLRWIEKKSVSEICSLLGKRRSAVKLSLRTIRKCGFSELDLTIDERKTIEDQLHADELKYGGLYR